MVMIKCFRIVLLLFIAMIFSVYLLGMRHTKLGMSKETIVALECFKQCLEKERASVWHQMKKQFESDKKINFIRLLDSDYFDCNDECEDRQDGEQVLDFFRSIDFLGFIPKKELKRVKEDLLEEFMKHDKSCINDLYSEKKQENFDFDIILKEVAAYGNKETRRILCSYFNEHSEIVKTMDPEYFVFALMQMENSIDKKFNFYQILMNVYLYGNSNALICLIEYFNELIDLQLFNIFETVNLEIKKPKYNKNKKIISKFLKQINFDKDESKNEPQVKFCLADFFDFSHKVKRKLKS
ncbi:MAG: hypothetical protein ABH827_02190 [bacterium]